LLDVVVSVSFNAELLFEITGTNRPKWLEKPVTDCTGSVTGVSGCLQPLGISGS
jgi:hypothetical protein